LIRLKEGKQEGREREGGRERGREEGRKMEGRKMEGGWKEDEKEEILPARNTYCRIDMANLSSPPYMELIFIFFFCCFPVYWVVKIHALGVLPLPVSPNQVAAHAQQCYYP
jgi:hypothetical protein